MIRSASTRLEFRIRPEAKKRIEYAADLVHESSSDFVRTAAERRADEVLVEHAAVTVVPADFFDRILSALDEAQRPNAALKRSATRARRVIKP
ncbi:MAG: DUF1778 domain-containing protein [Solirubrobacteraceae bacterium]